MKREIKFRGYSHIHEWVYGDLNQYPDGETYISENSDGEYLSYLVDPSTIGQYIGLKDINGKKIYEGDILCEIKTNRKVVVGYDAPHFCYADNNFGYILLNLPKNYMVIGNIHDNPELINDEL